MALDDDDEYQQTICEEDILADIWVWRERHKNAILLSPDGSDSVARSMLRFVDDCSLVRCDDLFPTAKVQVYLS